VKEKYLSRFIFGNADCRLYEACIESLTVATQNRMKIITRDRLEVECPFTQVLNINVDTVWEVYLQALVEQYFHWLNPEQKP